MVQLIAAERLIRQVDIPTLIEIYANRTPARASREEYFVQG
jgi:hypothetical protein